MGYRHYFIKVEKTKIKELEKLTERKLQTLWYNLPRLEKEDRTKYNRYGRYDDSGIAFCTSDSGRGYHSNFEDFAYAYLNQYNNRENYLHELGKLYWDNTEERLVSKGKEPKYKDEKIRNRITEDHCFVIGGEEMLEEYMEICKEKYTNYLDSLINHIDEDKLESMNSWIKDMKESLENSRKSKDKELKTIMFNDFTESNWSKPKLVPRRKVIKRYKEELKKGKERRDKYLKDCEKNKDSIVFTNLKKHIREQRWRAKYLGSDWEFRTAYTKLHTMLKYNLIDFDKYYVLLYAY